MLEGVQILIDRMESNPEDFVRQPGYYTLGEDAPRFIHIADALEEVLMGRADSNRFVHLTSEEKAALLVAYRKMMRQAFTAGVISQVFGDEHKHKRLLVTPKKVGQGFQNAPLKAEGSNVVYYGSNGVEIERQQAFTEKLRLEMQRTETEMKIRAWAKDSE